MVKIFIGIPTFLSSALKIFNLVTPVPTMPISILYQRLTKKSLPTLFKPPFPTEAGGGGAYDDDDINTGKESIQEEKPVKNCVNLNSLPWKNTLDKSSGQ